MHTAHTTAEAAERRKHKLEEVQKRKAYRVAHGLEKADSQGMELGSVGAVAVGGSAEGKEGNGDGNDGEFVEFEGRSKRPVRKWLGIWG